MHEKENSWLIDALMYIWNINKIKTAKIIIEYVFNTVYRNFHLKARSQLIYIHSLKVSKFLFFIIVLYFILYNFMWYA